MENLALRHQINILRRRGRRRLHLKPSDRLLWVWLARLWAGWRSALVTVKPETVIAWHRRGFRLYWTWKSRSARAGRPDIPQEVRDLIGKMSLVNPLWGAPRLHGELLKLGIEVSQATVAKYMARQRKPPSQTWRTFLNHHVRQLASTDFFVVPTVRFRVLYGSLSLWRTIGDACSISTSPPIPRPDGRRSKSLRPSLGATHRVTSSLIATRFMKGHSASEFEGWEWRKS